MYPQVPQLSTHFSFPSCSHILSLKRDLSLNITSLQRPSLRTVPKDTPLPNIIESLIQLKFLWCCLPCLTLLLILCIVLSPQLTPFSARSLRAEVMSNYFLQVPSVWTNPGCSSQVFIMNWLTDYINDCYQLTENDLSTLLPLRWPCCCWRYNCTSFFSCKK